MLKNLVSRSEFARLCGVSAAAVTKACSSALAPACSGKRIDVNHIAATTYRSKQDQAQIPEPAPGVDPLYAQAVDFCRTHPKPTPRSLRSALSIGSVRAGKIFTTIKATGILDLPEVSDESIPAMPPVKSPRVVSGKAAQTQTKKSEALQNIEHGQTLHQVPEEIEKFADMTLREIIERFGSDYAFVDWLKAMKAIEDINEKRLKNAQTRGELVNRQLVKVGVIDPIDSVHIKLLTDGAKTIARRSTAMHDAGRPLEDVEKFVAEQITSFIRPVKSKVARALRNC